MEGLLGGLVMILFGTLGFFTRAERAKRTRDWYDSLEKKGIYGNSSARTMEIFARVGAPIVGGAGVILLVRSLTQVL